LEESLLFEGIECIYILLMTLKVIKLDPANIDMEKIKEAAGLIDDGALVAFPTETVYGIACRVENGTLGKLNKLKDRSPDKHITLHIAELNEVDAYVPTIRLNAQKLIRKAWPGPLTIVFELDKTDIEKQRDKLERDVFDNLYKNDSIGIRCPDHPVATALLKHTHHPVVAPSANLGGESPAIDADQVFQRLSDRIDMVLDAGPSRYGLNSTIVKMGKKGLELLRSGVFSEEHLRTLSRIQILFVCTGNTCRSPMAEGMFRKYLAEKLNANIDELEKIGYKIDSAGIIGSVGFPATEQAVIACANKGIDIGSHFNKGLTKDLIEESDFIYVMERMHREKVVAMDPGASNRCYLLEENGQIPDPIGRPQAFYNSCADRIERAVKKRISELKI
jgi:L-threonylcarbamoyladenylate synthase